MYKPFNDDPPLFVIPGPGQDSTEPLKPWTRLTGTKGDQGYSHAVINTTASATLFIVYKQIHNKGNEY